MALKYNLIASLSTQIHFGQIANWQKAFFSFLSLCFSFATQAFSRFLFTNPTRLKVQLTNSGMSSEFLKDFVQQQQQQQALERVQPAAELKQQQPAAAAVMLFLAA